jgi:hypothetical protein
LTSEEPQRAGADFWQASGFHLLERGVDGLVVTDDFLRAYLMRPELRPVAESCAAEIDLHGELMARPRTAVEDRQLALLADEAAQDNYRAFLRFRDLLLAHASIEAAYLSLFRAGQKGIAPLFIDQLAHVILRGMLADCVDPFRLRAAELLFRTQMVTVDDGAAMLADDEIVEMRAAQAEQSRELLQPAVRPHTHVEMDVMGEANAGGYWARSDRFDMALNIGFSQPGLDSLCRVLESWVAHFLGVRVSIQPVQQISDERWVWHVGLDAEASAILNALYRGETPPEATIARLLSLFRLEFLDPGDMREDIAGRPVYLAMAMDAQKRLRVKPQNLLVGLPLASIA